MDEIKEAGEAGFSCELKDGVISIYHHEGHALLKRWVGSGNDWDKIWKLFDQLSSGKDDHELDDALFEEK